MTSIHDRLSRSLRVPAPEACPRLLLIMSPCRCGSTALARAFASAGSRVYYQPLKTILRYGLVGETVRWAVPASGAHDHLVVKETFGPYLREECELDPVGALLDAGVPPERVTVVALLRDPLAVYASWRQWWPDATLDLLVAAFDNAGRRAAEASARGVAVRRCVLEGAAADPEAFLRAVFAACGRPFGPEAVDWSATGGETRLEWTATADGMIPNASRSRIIMPRQPERFGAGGVQLVIHDALARAPSFQVTPRPTAAIPPSVVSRLHAEGVFAWYETFRRESAAETTLAVVTE